MVCYNYLDSSCWRDFTDNNQPRTEILLEYIRIYLDQEAETVWSNKLMHIQSTVFYVS